MASQGSYYDLLQVSKSATESDIKKAYRKLALKYHPDKNTNDPTASEKFKDLQHAYDHLIDPEERQKYDDSITPKPSTSRNAYPGYKNSYSPRDPFSYAAPSPAQRPSTRTYERTQKPESFFSFFSGTRTFFSSSSSSTYNSSGDQYSRWNSNAYGFFHTPDDSYGYSQSSPQRPRERFSKPQKPQPKPQPRKYPPGDKPYASSFKRPFESDKSPNKSSGVEDPAINFRNGQDYDPQNPYSHQAPSSKANEGEYFGATKSTEEESGVPLPGDHSSSTYTRKSTSENKPNGNLPKYEKVNFKIPTPNAYKDSLPTKSTGRYFDTNYQEADEPQSSNGRPKVNSHFSYYVPQDYKSDSEEPEIIREDIKFNGGSSFGNMNKNDPFSNPLKRDYGRNNSSNSATTADYIDLTADDGIVEDVEPPLADVMNNQYNTSNNPLSGLNDINLNPPSSKSGIPYSETKFTPSSLGNAPNFKPETQTKSKPNLQSNLHPNLSPPVASSQTSNDTSKREPLETPSFTELKPGGKKQKLDNPKVPSVDKESNESSVPMVNADNLPPSPRKRATHNTSEEIAQEELLKSPRKRQRILQDTLNDLKKVPPFTETTGNFSMPGISKVIAEELGGSEIPDISSSTSSKKPTQHQPQQPEVQPPPIPLVDLHDSLFVLSLKPPNPPVIPLAPFQDYELQNYGSNMLNYLQEWTKYNEKMSQYRMERQKADSEAGTTLLTSSVMTIRYLEALQRDEQANTMWQEALLKHRETMASFAKIKIFHEDRS